MSGSRRKRPETGLSEQQQRFADEYLVDYDAKAAYGRAGYKASGRGAEVNAAKLLASPLVQARIRERATAIANKIELTAEQVLKEAARVAFFDPRRLFRADGTLKPAHEWDDDVAAVVSSLEVQEETEGEGIAAVSAGSVKKLKLWSKNDMLGKLMLHFGLLTKKVHVTGEINYAERLQAARARAKSK